MITDKQQIQKAKERMLAQEMYLPLTREVFDETCPNPTMAVNVVARNADEAAILLKIELAQIDDLPLSGIVALVQSTAMTMQDLVNIDSAFPYCERFKRGISFTEPEGGEVEVWFFAMTSKNSV